MKLIFKVIFLTFLICSCNEEYKISTESETLNDLVNSTDIQRLNLDKFPVDTVYAERFIHFQSEDLEQQEVFMSRVVSLMSTDNYFYVINQKAPFIVQFDKAGNYLKKIGREGEGPAEFNQIKKVAKDKAHFYILDSGNARIYIFDHKMNFQSAFTKENISFAMNQSDMFAHENMLYVQNINGQNKALRILMVNSSPHSVKTYLPRLVPPGKQPKAVNVFHGDVNSNGTTSIAYLGLPYIISFDSSEQVRNTIVLESSEFEGRIVSLHLMPDEGLGVGVVHVISAVYWITKDTLMVVNPNIMTILKKQGDEFKVIGRYKIEYASEEEAQNHQYGVNLRVMDFDNEFMYLTSSFDNGVYRFPLSKIGL